jgi:hypothetical protein
MIRTLTVLGILLVLLGGGMAAMSASGNDGATSVASQSVPEDAPQQAAPAAGNTASATPAPVANRENCDTIRGTNYLSAEERAWFLAQCVPH